MRDDDTGKKVGLVGAGLAGLLGLLAKMEHCVVAGGKAAAPAVHLAGDGARVGGRLVPLAGEGAAIGAGVGRQAATFGKSPGLARVAVGGRVFEGSGLRAVPLLSKDAVQIGAPRISPFLLEHGGTAAGLGGDLGGYAFDAATLVVEGNSLPGDGLPYEMLPSVSGRSTLIALSPGATEVDIAAEPRKMILRPAQIHGLDGLLAAFPLLRRASPSVIVGRGPAGEVRIPEGTPTPAAAIASSCAAAGVVCSVVVCPDDAPATCERQAAEAWRRAANGLSPAPRDPGVAKELADFEARLLPALAGDPATNEATVAFVAYGPDVRVVRATPVVSRKESPGARLALPAWASCIASTRSTPPRSGRSRRACSTPSAACAVRSPCSGW